MFLSEQKWLFVLLALYHYGSGLAMTTPFCFIILMEEICFLCSRPYFLDMKMENRKNTVIYLILLMIISFTNANLDSYGIKGDLVFQPLTTNRHLTFATSHLTLATAFKIPRQPSASAATHL